MKIIKIQSMFFLTSLLISLFLFDIKINAQVKQINLKSNAAYTVIVNLKKLKLELYNNSTKEMMFTTGVGVGFANKYPECEGKSDSSCGYGSSYYNMSLAKTPVYSGQLWSGGKINSDDGAIRSYGFPITNVCDKNFRPPDASQLEKCSGGYLLPISLHGSSNPTGYSSHGCIRVSESAINTLKNYLKDDNINWIEIVNSDYTVNSNSTSSSKPSTPTSRLNSVLAPTKTPNKASSIMNKNNPQFAPKKTNSTPTGNICDKGKNVISDGPKSGACSTCSNGTSYYWSTNEYKCSPEKK
jgi:L,D-transpeptidase catalytic domain